MIDHCLEVLPDEGLYNLLTRSTYANGYTRHLEAARRFLGKPKATSIVDSEVDLTRVSAVIGNVKDWKAKLTPIKLAQHLGYDECHIGADLLSLSFGDPGKIFWRVCPQCIEFDDIHHGVGYWHQSHQLPTTLVCPEHFSALIEKQLPKKWMHEQFFFPHHLSNKEDLSTPPLNMHMLGLAVVGQHGLSDHSMAHEQSTILRTFRAALEMRGLLTPSGNIRRYEYLDQFDRFFGPSFKFSMKTRMRIKSPLVLLNGITSNGVLSLYSRIILVYWLFGSWVGFKARCYWQEFFPESPVLPRVIKTGLSEVCQLHRQSCLDFMAANLQGTRDDFIKSSYKSFKWLLHQDREWLDLHLPISKAYKQVEMF